MFGLIVFFTNVPLFLTSKTELAPQEDQGVIITQSISAPNSTLQQRQLYSRQVYKIFAAHSETEHVFQLDVPGQSIAGMVFKPWDARQKTTTDLQPVMPVLSQAYEHATGVKLVVSFGSSSTLAMRCRISLRLADCSGLGTSRRGSSSLFSSANNW